MTNEKKDSLTIIQETQAMVEQMKIDDLEEQPEEATQEFQCSCCGDIKMLAGSMIYGNFMYCNDCVLLTETSLALGKVQDPLDMMDVMKDKRFENVYHATFGDNEEMDEE